MTWLELYKATSQFLKLNEIYEYQSEVSIIFEDLFGMTYSDVILKSKDIVEANCVERVNNVCKLRKEGIPIQYALGKSYFMGRYFFVGDGVLIPREDTTVLVNCGIDYLKNKNDCPHIIDLCSGTGCVAISLEKNLKNESVIYAVELYKEAFEYLKKNLLIHGSKVRTICGDVFSVFKEFEDEYFDCIVSNPPYLTRDEMQNLQLEVKKEPSSALYGGIDGLDFYRNICNLWTCKIKIGGMLAFEIGMNQENDVKKIMEFYGFKNILFLNDINGIIRVVSGIKI